MVIHEKYFILEDSPLIVDPLHTEHVKLNNPLAVIVPGKIFILALFNKIVQSCIKCKPTFGDFFCFLLIGFQILFTLICEICGYSKLFIP